MYCTVPTLSGSWELSDSGFTRDREFLSRPATFGHWASLTNYPDFEKLLSVTTKVSKRVSQNSCCHGVPSWFERHVMARFHDGVVMVKFLQCDIDSECVVVSVRKSVLLS